MRIKLHIKKTLLILLLITMAFPLFCYAQENDGHYYDQFTGSYWKKEQQQALIGVFWIIVPVLLVGCYYLASRDNPYKFLILSLLAILLVTIVPLIRFNLISPKAISEVNTTRYSMDPIGTMKAYPLQYDMDRTGIIARWGVPRNIRSYWGSVSPITHKSVFVENWFYSRKEPQASIIWWNLKRGLASLMGWNDFYAVTLTLYDGKLAYSNPGLEDVNRGMVPKES